MAASLKQDYAKILNAGAELVMISPDSFEQHRQYALALFGEDLPYLFVSDSDLDIARHYGLPLTPHSPYLGPRQALSTHFCATLPELPVELEFAAALPQRPMDWYSPQIEVKDGRIAVPTGPGLGIEFAPEVLSGLRIVD